MRTSYRVLITEGIRIYLPPISILFHNSLSIKSRRHRPIRLEVFRDCLFTALLNRAQNCYRAFYLFIPLEITLVFSLKTSETRRLT